MKNCEAVLAEAQKALAEGMKTGKAKVGKGKFTEQKRLAAGHRVYDRYHVRLSEAFAKDLAVKPAEKKKEVEKPKK